MNDWIDPLHTLASKQVPAVLVTIVSVRGSSPRGIGARMIVTTGACHGSVGGGQLEHRCTATARHMLGQADQPRLEKYVLGEPLDQCCGGAVEVLFEPVSKGVPAWLEDLHGVDPHRHRAVLATALPARTPCKTVIHSPAQLPDLPLPGDVSTAARELLEAGHGVRLVDGVLLESITAADFNIAVFGAGHVGTALVRTLSGLDADIHWIDDREGVFTKVPARVRAIPTTSPAREVYTMPPGSFYLVMTHSHELDFGICTAVLSRADTAYCGLIGSASKRRRFEKRFIEHGLDQTTVKTLVCPIGIDGIGGKQPAAIAIATAAEILRVHERLHAAKET